MKEVFELREIKKEEIDLAISLIKEFSVYVDGKDTTNIDREAMKKCLFDDGDIKHLFIESNKKVIGYVNYFYLFSTFKGRKGIYLEDVYVKEEYRGLGVGKKVFDYLLEIVKKDNLCKLEWNCIRTNENAMSFYLNKLQAKDMDEYRFFTINN